MLLLGVGVAAATLVLGAALAVLVSFHDFPGRRRLDWGVAADCAPRPEILAASSRMAKPSN